MSKVLSLKMADEIFSETEKVLKKIRMPRNAYINKAVDFYNRCQKRLLTRKKLKREVGLLKEDTQSFLNAFDHLQDLSE